MDGLGEFPGERTLPWVRRSSGVAFSELRGIVDDKFDRLAATEEMLIIGCWVEEVPWVIEPVFEVVVKLLRPKIKSSFKV